MGCDIHAHVEVLKDGAWRNASLYSKTDNELERVNPVCDRWYHLFSQMAGVRNYSGETPISEPRGLPSDISLETKLDSEEWGADGHSHSWLTFDEMRDYTKALPEENRTMTALLQIMTISANAYWVFDKAKIRIVFWFDN